MPARPAAPDPVPDPAADPRLAQVRARDRAADGHFVYAVTTTGVFCRPSCPSRPARTANIRFFDTPAAAAAAGFRPCRRCRPDATAPQDDLGAKMRAIAAHIAAHADETLTLDRLAHRAGMSRFHFQRSFRAAIGLSPREYQAAARLDRLKSGLRAGQPVLDAAFDAGYGSPSRAYAQANRALGMTPSSYRAGGAGETITHATTRTALGPLLMAATARGICFVAFGEDEASLRARLAAEFPKASLVPASTGNNAELAAWMVAIDAHLARAAPRPDLPLDLRGTVFQTRVWRFLLGRAPGETVTYSEIARAIGAPRAIRAAASACAANRIAVLVPCHLALRSDGGLGGYRWGLDRKRALLDIERAEPVPARDA